MVLEMKHDRLADVRIVQEVMQVRKVSSMPTTDDDKMCTNVQCSR